MKNKSDDLNKQKLPSVVDLNVGGKLYTTRLCTLRRYPDSLLAAMFSGKYRLDHDEAYRIFIDRDGAYFQYILNWLRDDELPPVGVADAVLKEARFYGLQALVTGLQSYPLMYAGVDGLHSTLYGQMRQSQARGSTMQNYVLMLSAALLAILFCFVGYAVSQVKVHLSSLSTP
ncbi:PREDICTED: BTB/POZ domain-containing protein KCTD7-like [Priapulus caudatus]|uniref:BTB/POZ domain-containing protein KCTD7-like n=1 Tax=Priapulus caudatus TaxID=37621 RepID=A0ABM1EBG0_PRICU|nr:PREDICTED: BTB/POZ domain-containing protein KCTD7-like [Priapulus caudatus]